MNYRLYKKKGIITDLFDEFTAKVKVEKYTVKIDQVRMNGIRIIQQGIHLGLESEIEKYSEALQKNVTWKKEMRIKSLPKFICVQVSLFI